VIPNPAQTFTAVTVVWVAVGGAIGSLLRFAIAEAVRRLPALAGLPWATLAVNVIGSLVLGFFMRWATDTDTSPQVRAFVMIGICGGFTTFSTFALEGATMIHDGQIVRAAAYAMLSVVLSIGAVFAGYALAR